MFIIGKLPEVSRAGSDVWAGTRSRAAASSSLLTGDSAEFAIDPGFFQRPEKRATILSILCTLLAFWKKIHFSYYLEGQNSCLPFVGSASESSGAINNNIPGTRDLPKHLVSSIERRLIILPSPPSTQPTWATSYT